MSIGDGNLDDDEINDSNKRDHQGWGGQGWSLAEFWVELEPPAAIVNEELTLLPTPSRVKELVEGLAPRQVERGNISQSLEVPIVLKSPSSYSKQTLGTLGVENSSQINLLKNQLINPDENILDLRVSQVEVDPNKTVLSLFDKAPGRIYYADLSDGSRLPDGISIDPITGQIVIDDALRDENFSIRITAYATDGKNEVLEINLSGQVSAVDLSDDEILPNADDTASNSDFNKKLNDEALRDFTYVNDIIALFNQIDAEQR